MVDCSILKVAPNIMFNFDLSFQLPLSSIAYNIVFCLETDKFFKASKIVFVFYGISQRSFDRIADYI